eukprot:814472-Amphidinium_carterae.1
MAAWEQPLPRNPDDQQQLAEAIVNNLLAQLAHLELDPETVDDIWPDLVQHAMDCIQDNLDNACA